MSRVQIVVNGKTVHESSDDRANASVECFQSEFSTFGAVVPPPTKNYNVDMVGNIYEVDPSYNNPDARKVHRYHGLFGDVHTLSPKDLFYFRVVNFFWNLFVAVFCLGLVLLLLAASL